MNTLLGKYLHHHIQSAVGYVLSVAVYLRDPVIAGWPVLGAKIVDIN